MILASLNFMEEDDDYLNFFLIELGLILCKELEV